jgi:hypothetical protein
MNKNWLKLLSFYCNGLIRSSANFSVSSLQEKHAKILLAGLLSVFLAFSGVEDSVANRKDFSFWVQKCSYFFK